MFQRLHMALDASRIQTNPPYSYLEAQCKAANVQILRYVYDKEKNRVYTVDAMSMLHGSLAKEVGSFPAWEEHREWKDKKGCLNGFINLEDLPLIKKLGSLIRWVKQRHMKEQENYIPESNPDVHDINRGDSDSDWTIY
jgi:hypothetical protein